MSEQTGSRDPGDADASDPGSGRGEHEWAMGETEWVESPEPEEPGGERAIPMFIVGALAGVVALCLIWGITAILTSPTPTASSDRGTVDTTPATGTPTKTEPSRQAQPSPRPDGCHRAAAELAAPLRAAVPAVDQWEVHVGAMNKLVVGAITPDQASAFWAQSKVGAQRNLSRFEAATRRVTSAHCPAPAAVRPAPTELRSCARRVARERRVLDAARTTMRTWQTHIRDMEMLRMGHLSPAAGTRRWLANWERGVGEIRDYRAAERALDRSDGC
jgi:hypothetical protein